METLSGHRFLFPASITIPGSRRPNDDSARTGAGMNADIEILIAWVNETFRRPDSAVPIPPDPTRRVHAARFRRSLAYFIVRRPRGPDCRRVAVCARVHEGDAFVLGQRGHLLDG